MRNASPRSLVRSALTPASTYAARRSVPPSRASWNSICANSRTSSSTPSRGVRVPPSRPGASSGLSPLMPRILSGVRVCGIMVAMTPSPRSRSRSRSLLLSRGAVATSLLAVLAGGAVTGGLMASAMYDPNTPAADRIKAIVPQVDPRTLSGPAYADAVPGTCLTWAVDERDRVTSFSAVDCAEPHRFEVAGRIDLDEVPGFGRDAPLPDQDALATVGTDQCMPMVDGYTGGRQVDPEGRFTGLVDPPSAEGWDKGDHA